MACIGPYSQALTMMGNDGTNVAMGHTPKSTGSSLIGLVEGTILPENHGKPCIWWGKRYGFPVDFPFNQSIESLKHWWIIYYFHLFAQWNAMKHGWFRTHPTRRAPLPALCQAQRCADVLCSSGVLGLVLGSSAASCRLEPGHWGYYTSWLVVWNMIFIFPYIGNNTPIWLIFFIGIETTNQTRFRYTYWTYCWIVYSWLLMIVDDWCWWLLFSR